MRLAAFVLACELVAVGSLGAQTATVTATLNGSSKSANIVIRPPVTILSLSCPESIEAGNSGTCTLTINQPAPIATVVPLVVSSVTVVGVQPFGTGTLADGKTPATLYQVTIPKGASSITFQVSAPPLTPIAAVQMPKFAGLWSMRPMSNPRDWSCSPDRAMERIWCGKRAVQAVYEVTE